MTSYSGRSGDENKKYFLLKITQEIQKVGKVQQDLYCGGPIAWYSRKQPLVALSTTETEVAAAAECIKELLYLKSIIDELTEKNLVLKLYINN